MINRLMGIVYILLNRGTITATEMAEHFEVSERTIYRDVEQLSMAGIPIYSRRGRNGGISLMDQFVLDKMLISEEEQKNILSALTSLRETGALQEDKTLQKLGEFFKTEVPDWVAIDFSDWNCRQKHIFEQLRQAILNRCVLEFDYYGQYGDMSHRTVEPIQLLYKEYTWYLRAFCRKRNAMRLFKISRMKRVAVTEEVFEGSFESYIECETANVALEGTVNKAREEIKTADIIFQVDKKEAYRIFDRFDEDEITVLPNGNFQISIKCPVDDWLCGLILSFGPSAKVISPEYLKEDIIRRTQEMLQNYL